MYTAQYAFPLSKKIIGQRGIKMEYENFVFYGSWRETLEGFLEDFGEEYAKEASLFTPFSIGNCEIKNRIVMSASLVLVPDVQKCLRFLYQKQDKRIWEMPLLFPEENKGALCASG